MSCLAAAIADRSPFLSAAGEASPPQPFTNASTAHGSHNRAAMMATAGGFSLMFTCLVNAAMSVGNGMNRATLLTSVWSALAGETAGLFWHFMQNSLLRRAPLQPVLENLQSSHNFVFAAGACVHLWKRLPSAFQYL